MKNIKNNNKGFMLVEVIVVTVVVVTIMTSLYMVFNRVYNAYDRKNTYTDIDSIYALKMIEDYMIDIENSNLFMFNNLIDKNVSYTKIDCGTANDNFNTYCTAVFEEYNVNEMYIVKNNEGSLNGLKGVVTNQTFKDYIDYLKNIGIHTIKFIGNNKKYTNLLIVETHSIDSGTASDKKILNKYAYLPIGLE